MGVPTTPGSGFLTSLLPVGALICTVVLCCIRRLSNVRSNRFLPPLPPPSSWAQSPTEPAGGTHRPFFLRRPQPPALWQCSNPLFPSTEPWEQFSLLELGSHRAVSRPLSYLISVRPPVTALAPERRWANVYPSRRRMRLRGGASELQFWGGMHQRKSEAPLVQVWWPYVR